MPHMSSRPRPSRDWLLFLMLGVVLLLVSIGWNIWTFIRITNGEAAQSAMQVPTGPDVTALEKVRAVFQARTLEEQRYLVEYRFVDPSK